MQDLTRVSKISMQSFFFFAAAAAGGHKLHTAPLNLTSGPISCEASSVMAEYHFRFLNVSFSQIFFFV